MIGITTIISVLNGFGWLLLCNVVAKALPVTKNACQWNIVVWPKTSFLYAVFSDAYVCFGEYPKAGFTFEQKQNANANRRVKTKRMFNVDVLLRRGKQHPAGWWMFVEQLNGICRLLVLKREFTFAAFKFRIYTLPRWMLNSVQMYHRFCLASLTHASFAFWCKPTLIRNRTEPSTLISFLF